ncbi:hypothetical protein PR202_gb03297 [Eleusine coracana subsp. coracana]|uniref:Fe2OG dioxygenase domain-containing protein n=1 Tax=Eleusine coracana subsp. coracana TaxID=191504 RepID=A0AAV5E0V1_ELECO|nr:hypothetical protein QOZ80_8BG0658930 [Eleusine coracana subsp. coracana]GJN16250.1 hypothetical protein PR202_gb03216 [Eleusine coracana subsp. coracana]GJN16321.1 hypothetical protein PR202_gb03297 [Eleusine coracana subsp. coracana]
MEELGRVDLRGLQDPGSPGWEEARAAVAASMLAHGCVLVVAGVPAPELRDALFGRVLPDLFVLPRDVKLRNAPGPPPNTGYFCHGVQESARINHADDADSLRAFADLLWPDAAGDKPLFCEAVAAAEREMQRLDGLVVRMVLESLGLPAERVVAAPPLADANRIVRLSHYAARPGPAADDGGGVLSMAAHYDYSFITVLMQHDVEGLEVLARDGRWVAVPPERDTCAVIAGELLTVMTNGRVPACLHRVRTPSGRERFLALMSTLPAGTSVVVGPLNELVDGAHPRLYRPVDYAAYARFKYSDDGRELGNRTLEAFCGVVNKEGAGDNDGVEVEQQGIVAAG